MDQKFKSKNPQNWPKQGQVAPDNIQQIFTKPKIYIIININSMLPGNRITMHRRHQMAPLGWSVIDEHYPFFRLSTSSRTKTVKSQTQTDSPSLASSSLHTNYNARTKVKCPAQITPRSPGILNLALAQNLGPSF